MGNREMAQWLKVHTTLAEARNSILTTAILTTINYNASSKGSNTSSGFCGHLHSYEHILPPPPTHTTYTDIST